MQLAGLSLGQLLALAGAASAITVVLYLLRLRRLRVPVGFIPLWESLLAERRASQWFRRLRHFGSLLLALCVVALLCLALGDPRPQAETAATRHVVVLVDAGVTMQTRDVAPNRLHAALERARGIVRGARSNVRMLVVQLDAAATPLGAFSSEPHELERALAQVVATDLVSDAQRGYRFALDVLRGQSRPEVVLLSDAAEPPEPELQRAFVEAHVAVSHVVLRRRDDDVGISAFALRRYPLDRNRGELLLELHNASAHREQVELTLLGDGSAIDVQRLALEAGATSQRIYDDVTGVARTLEARLRVEGDHDDLPANDRAFALVPAKRRVRVLCVTEGNRYLEAALLLDEYLDVDVIAPARYVAARGYDAVIFDRIVPAAVPEVPALYLEPDGRGPGQPLEVAGRIERPFFEHVQREHPALRFTALRDVNVASALLLKPQPGDVILAGDARGPLIVAGQRAGQPFLALGFDVQASDLPLRVAWPLLLLNTLDWFTGGSNDYVPGASVGQTLTWSLPPSATRVQLESPGGMRRELQLAAGQLVFTPQRAGFYRVSWPGGERMLAVNLDPDPRRSLVPPPANARATALASPPVTRGGVPALRGDTTSLLAAFERPAWVLLLLAALGLLLGEWLAYHRRWTV